MKICILFILVILFIFNSCYYTRRIRLPNLYLGVPYYKYKMLLKKPIKIVKFYNAFVEDTYYEARVKHSWYMSYYPGSKTLKIGCRWGNKRMWDDFFDKDNSREYNTKRNTLAFKYIKVKYEQFIKELEKQNIL